MKKFTSCVLGLSLLLCSCSLYRIQSEEVSDNFYPPKESADGVVYMEHLSRPVEVVGYITVNAERVQKLDEVIMKLKKEAAVLGADAITNVQSGATAIWKKLPQKAFENGYVRANFTATAVVFK